LVKKLKQMLRFVNKMFIRYEQVLPKVEMTQKERAMYAKQIRDNPLWEEVLSELKQQALITCERSPARDIEGREYLWKYIRAIEQLKSKIQSHVWNDVIEEKKEQQNPTL